MYKAILDSLINTPGIIFFALDTEYKYKIFSQNHSQTMLQIWGEEIREGLCMLDVILDPYDKIRAKRNFDRVLSGESFVERENYGDDALYRSLWENRYIPLKKNDTIEGVIVIVTELGNLIEPKSDYNQVDIFENIVNLVGVGITLANPYDKEYPLVFVNDGFTKITGYTKEEALGKNCRFLQRQSLDPNIKQHIRSILEKEQTCEIVVDNYTKRGKLFKNFLTISPIYNKKGKLLYYAGIQVDVTKSLEEKKMDALKEIAEGLTHEINTALASMKGNIDLLEYDIENIPDESLRRVFYESNGAIGASLKTIQKISRSLHFLNASRLDRFEDVYVLDTVNIAVSFFHKKLTDNDINVIYDQRLLDKSVLMQADKEALVHLWKVLIENAIDALCEIDKKRQIDIVLSSTHEHINAIISDNAIGIDEKIVGNLFQPLVKAKTYRGVGIGLNVAKSIVQMHGGNIVFDTSKEGTSFIVTLPLTQMLEEELL